MFLHEEVYSFLREVSSLSKTDVTLEYGNVPLPQFTVSFQADKKRFRAVKLLQRFDTQYRSPQLSLWSEDEVKWLLARRLPDYRVRHRQPHEGSGIAQLPLFA